MKDERQVSKAITESTHIYRKTMLSQRSENNYTVEGEVLEFFELEIISELIPSICKTILCGLTHQLICAGHFIRYRFTEIHSYSVTHRLTSY